jgi:nitrite reductase/ring-hydroxylating ferredoxin subunit
MNVDASDAGGDHQPARANETAFPESPVGWFHLCHSREMRTGPVRGEVGDRTFVGFRDATGRAVTLDGRCSHLSAGLWTGDVTAGRLRCPLHGWEYGGDGKCFHIPAATRIPSFAGQSAYPTVEVGPVVAFCNVPVAPFPFPFFDGVDPDDLLPAEPFDFAINVPWYLVGANGFDLQHFRMAHDRALVGEPVVDAPAPFARRIVADFDVAGRSVRDRLTRRFSGPRVRMAVTSWAGTVILVTASFRRTTSYGMVFVRPLAAEGAAGGRSLVRIVVWVPRRGSRLGRAVVDPVDAAVRRRFIRAFLRPDVTASDGVRYTPATLIDADRELADYMRWLSRTCRGEAAPPVVGTTTRA